MTQLVATYIFEVYGLKLTARRMDAGLPIARTLRVRWLTEEAD